MAFGKAPNETTLISRAIKGDAEAFGLLYSHYRIHIHLFFFVHVNDRTLAEDMSQEVFFRAWRRVRTYEDRGMRFSAWLYQIARNEMIDFFRAQQEMYSIDDPLSQVRLPPVVMELERGMDLAKQCRRVGQAMEALSSQHQQVLRLRFIEELSIREAAKVMAKTEGATKLLQFRAIQQLRNVFAFYCQSA